MGLPVIVYGAGGLGREVMQIARAALDPGEYHALGYADDGVSAGTVLNGYPVLGGGEYLENTNENIALVLGIADPEIKAGIFRRFKGKNNITFPNVIHPSALISEYAALRRGVVAAQGSLISVDAVLGDCVFINYGATIGHDVRISGFSSVMPLTAISGWVK
ncbi:MAG: hypothetical protein LBU26_06190, partial [Synergistaceae bacterium]|nr:hypothetical protein [Synergistaceae bacterium]